jgi:methionyl-tRNA synthetase
VETVAEEDYFFRLSAYTEPLLKHYEEHPEFVRPERARNELLGKLRLGLRDIPITRTSITWGVPVPWDDKHVVYVWIEALQNYITAVGYGADPARFERTWPAEVHLIGKEIVWHHAVVWPAMLLAAGLPLPKTVFAHGWLLVGGEKISKSGKSITQIAPAELVESYGVDAYRYHFLRATNFGEDGNFSLEDLEARYNAELANDLGNLASRTLSMIERYFGGVIPGAGNAEEAESVGGPAEAQTPERELLDIVERAKTKSDDFVRDLDITSALGEVWEIIRHANRYLVERAPWKLAKDESQMPLVGAVLNATAQALAALAALLSPAMPGTGAELWSRLGLQGSPALDAPSVEGNRVRVGEALFPRLES